MITFNSKINNIILFGLGGQILYDLNKFAKKHNLSLYLFTSPRQANEVVRDKKTLKEICLKLNIQFHVTDDINRDKNLQLIDCKKAVGIGLGEAWSFSKHLIDSFDGKLVDLMGIRLPQYRGGAHYTWQILRKNKIGCSNIQLINEHMIQGEFDSGEIIKSKEYFFPPDVRIPKDYFNYAEQQDSELLQEFVWELICGGKVFDKFKLQENFSIYFPRLYTKNHAYINWSWKTEDLELFINAFDDPYPGAMSFVGDRKVVLKDCYSEFNDGPFHPFQAGLIYKIYNQSIFIASTDGTLIVKKVVDENNNNILDNLELGQRFYTPIKYIEDAMQYSIKYDAQGLKSNN